MLRILVSADADLSEEFKEKVTIFETVVKHVLQKKKKNEGNKNGRRSGRKNLCCQRRTC